MPNESLARMTRTSGVPPPAWEAWVTANWGLVRVAHAGARVARTDAGVRLRVRAVVHLGRLTPADVHVEICRGGRGAARLWSVQAYRNGAYVFEATVFDYEISEAGDEDGLLVRVRPAQGYQEQRGASPIVAALHLTRTEVDSILRIRSAAT